MVQQKFKVEENLDYLVSKTVQIMKNSLYREFREKGYNITTEQWSVLAKLFYEDGIYQKQLGDYLYKDKPTITRILDLMEKKNFIIRISDDKDRRKSKIYLTQDGKDTVNELIPIAQEFQTRLINNISYEEIEHFTGTLEKLCDNTIKPA